MRRSSWGRSAVCMADWKQSSVTSLGESAPRLTNSHRARVVATMDSRPPYESARHRVMAWLPADSRTKASSGSRTRPGNRSASPMVINRMALSMISGRSAMMYSRRSRINMPTSSGGRSQFCAENAYKVRAFTPISRAARTTSCTAFAPRRWPSMRGIPLSLAHRPFPSMIMATWRGNAAGSIDMDDPRVPQERASFNLPRRSAARKRVCRPPRNRLPFAEGLS